MTGGIWHPDGCRCSGCRQPAVRPPARPQRPVASQPVYRRPRSHAYSCRCPKCVQATRRRRGGAEWVFPVFFGAVLLLAGIGWAARGMAHAVAAQPLAAALMAAGVIAVIAAVTMANKREAKRRARAGAQ